MNDALPRLMLVSDRARVRRGTLVEAIAAATHAGVRLVQLRESDLDADERKRLLDELTGRVAVGTQLLVNGDASLAAHGGAGLHLPEAAPPARHPPRPFGRAVHSLPALARALDEGVDYVVWGTLFATDSKPGIEPAGPAALRAACRMAGELPLFAIGGVTAERVAIAMEAGAWGVAVCGAILDTPDPARAARRLSEAMALRPAD